MSHPYPKGAIIKRDHYIRKILEEVGDLRAVSVLEDSSPNFWETECARWYHIEELKRDGWKVEGEGRWKPEYGDKYWFVDSDCEVLENVWHSDRVDAYRTKLGNYFQTEAEAKEKAEKIKALLKGE